MSNNLSAEIFDTDHNWSENFLFPRTVLLHSMLANCGFETRRTPDYFFDGMLRGQSEFAIFQLTIAGEGTLIYEGRTIKMHAGDAMLLHIPHAHQYFLEKGTPGWRHLFLTLYGLEAIRLMREAEMRYGPVVNLPRESLPVCKAVEILSAGYEKQLKSPFRVSAMTYDLAVSLLEFLMAEKSGAERQNTVLMRSVHNYCLKHLAEDISVDDLAKEAGFSRAHLSRVFHHLYGIPPAQFLTELRLRSAIRLLQIESCSIKELSVRCGFKDESYFCKVFRKYHSVSPEKFRQGKSAVPAAEP